MQLIKAPCMHNLGELCLCWHILPLLRLGSVFMMTITLHDSNMGKVAQ